MTEAIDYSKDNKRSRPLEINVQKMQLSVTNLTPQFPHQTKETVKQEVSSRLFRIFKNYDIRRNVLKVDKPPFFWKNILPGSLLPGSKALG